MEIGLQLKLQALQQIIAQYNYCAVAISGGVDSTFLTKVACDTLGKEKVVAVFVDSILQPSGEKAHVESVAGEIDCELIILQVDPFSVAQFADNPSNRCYYCKKTIYSLIRDDISHNHPSTLMDGTNYDDLSDSRPGLQALKELEVVTPLADAKITKEEIRRLSKEYGLSNWNRHSGSCLATRIPHGNPISPEELQKIDECENYLQSLDFLGCRVRTQGNIAIIELASGDKHRFLNPEVQENVKNSFLCSGFTGIQLSSTERKM